MGTVKHIEDINHETTCINIKCFVKQHIHKNIQSRDGNQHKVVNTLISDNNKNNEDSNEVVITQFQGEDPTQVQEFKENEWYNITDKRVTVKEYKSQLHVRLSKFPAIRHIDCEANQQQVNLSKLGKR